MDGKILPEFDPEAAEKMMAYPWPGNVRELDNVVQRALILQSGDKITVDDLVFEDADSMLAAMTGHMPSENIEALDNINEKPELGGLGDGVRSAEESIILQTLQMENGSRKATAEKLGISPRTLRYKMARMKDSGVIISC